MKLAHDTGGYLGYKKIKDVVGRIFTWPGVGQDILRSEGKENPTP